MITSIRRLALACVTVGVLAVGGASAAHADQVSPSVPAAAPPAVCAGLVLVNLGVCV